MNRLRNKLVLAFVAVTLLPLAATFWLTTQLLRSSLNYSSISELDEMSKSLEAAGREYYQGERDSLKHAAVTGSAPATEIHRESFDDAQREFWESGALERFVLAGSSGDQLEYLVRRPVGIAVFTRHLDVNMASISRQYRAARQLVQASKSRDLRR